jgi:hypothetical protein
VNASEEKMEACQEKMVAHQEQMRAEIKGGQEKKGAAIIRRKEMNAIMSASQKMNEAVTN